MRKTFTEHELLSQFPHNINVGSAIRSLISDEAVFTLSNCEDIDDYKIIDWKGTIDDPETVVPTHDEIAVELNRLQDLWVATQWKRDRRNDYPKMEEQLNKIYDDGVTKWKAEMVDPVKAKWPKDNSGPIE